ncbi:MAG: hypothetical protein M1524_00335 [Patescibacteria group bacterium]|nr:hypothetical protein [Patescibacteria group bacterium]
MSIMEENNFVYTNKSTNDQEFSRKKIIIFFAGFIFLITAVILIVLNIKKPQEIRQRAAPQVTQQLSSTENDVKKEVFIFYTRVGENNPIINFSLRPGESITLSLGIDTKNIKINGFDLTLNITDNLSVSNFEEDVDASRFNVMVFDGIKNQRFAKVSTNLQDEIKGKLRLAKITFTAQSRGTGSITTSHATITSIDRKIPIPVDQPVIAYTID